MTTDDSDKKIIEEVLKKYIGDSNQLTELDKLFNEMYKENKLYKGQDIILQVKGMYKDSVNSTEGAVKEVYNLTKQAQAKKEQEFFGEENNLIYQLINEEIDFAEFNEKRNELAKKYGMGEIK